jgi:CRISPR-associated protein Csb2
MHGSSLKNRGKGIGDAAPTAFRWRIVGDALPSLTVAYRVGMATRAAVYDAANARGLMPLPEYFHKSSGHSHAFWLPEDADEDGAIDHVLLVAACTIPWELLPVLAGRLALRLADLGEWRLLPESMGSTLSSQLFGPARRWVSLTSYVPPRLVGGRSSSGIMRVRKNHTPVLSPEERLRWEIGCRKLGAHTQGVARLPAIVRGDAALLPERFALRARQLKRLSPATTAPIHWHAPQDAKGTAIALTFNRPVSGPLAFGFGCHFGLGLFAPSEESTQGMDHTREVMHSVAIC